MRSRQLIAMPCSAARISRACLERFGDGDYKTAVQHLIRALGDDLSTMHGTSVQPARLNAVLKDLYQMEVLATMLEGCQRLADQMKNKHSLPAPRAGDLLQDVVAASGERWSNSGRFGAIADKHGAPGAGTPDRVPDGRAANGFHHAAQGLHRRRRSLQRARRRQGGTGSRNRPGKRAMNWIAQTFSEFGRSIGLAELDPGPNGLCPGDRPRPAAGLQGARRSGTDVPRTPARRRQTAVPAPRAGYMPPAPRLEPPGAAGLTRDGRLVFIVRLAAREFRPNTIEQAFDLLSRLHDRVSA